MKKPLPLLAAALAVAAFIYANITSGTFSKAAVQKALSYKKQYTLSCSPNLALLNFDDSTNSIPLLSGWGNYRVPVSATNDSARIYFEQGINMYYAFHIIEALASFEKATQFDSGFAMGYWGKALAYGPNINDYGYSASPDALIAVAKAAENKANCTAAEQALIEAMTVRYSADTTQTREHLNQLYAEAMQKVYQQNSNNPDIGVLYADALMLLHPWDFYDKNGKAKAWTPEIVQTLEAVLKTTPAHPGAAHYYIHAVEASNHPERALAVADKLPLLMPGVSHVVHMPAHIYIRTGNYKKGEAVNEQAIKSYYDYLGKYAPVVNNTPLYLIHNLHMQATCANMDGKFKTAQKLSMDTRNSFDSSWQDMPDFFGVFVQYIYMTPYLTSIRFGKWDDILQTPEIPASRVYGNLLWHYGRGLAYARKHQFDNAANELKAVQQAMTNSQLSAPAPPYANPGINGARVAEKILQGVIAEEQNNLGASITLLREAVNKEDAMVYDEPKDWVHPARQYLGNVLLKAKQYAAAEKTFKEDLYVNPNNGWSYTGLSQALIKGGKKNEAAAMQQKAATAFAETDVQITNAVF
jgi:tetratricopeptide (TPR) repeat protein